MASHKKPMPKTSKEGSLEKSRFANNIYSAERIKTTAVCLGNPHSYLRREKKTDSVNKLQTLLKESGPLAYILWFYEKKSSKVCEFASFCQKFPKNTHWHNIQFRVGLCTSQSKARKALKFF